MPNYFPHEDIDLRDREIDFLIIRKYKIIAARKRAATLSEDLRLFRLLVKNNEAAEAITDRYEVKG